MGITVEQKKRNRQVWKWIAILAGIIIAAVLFGLRFYHTIQSPHWLALSEAEAYAREQFQLEQIQSVERFVGDQVYYIAFGVNTAGEEVAVWFWEGDHELFLQKDGIGRQQIKEAALQENPAKRLFRISPGKLNDEYVWEVYYALEERDGERKYYDYYRFTDGKKLETYRMAIQR